MVRRWGVQGSKSPDEAAFAKATSKSNTMTAAKLPDDAHLSGSIVANANWFDAVFEFPPTFVPINPRNETVKSGSDRFWRAVFHPDAEPRRMFTFIDTGSWSAHPFVLWTNPVLGIGGVLPIGRN
jgi:hypothetical protein